MRILAIDNDTQTLALLRRVLGREGFDNVSAVGSPASARARIKAAWQPYDMIVSAALLKEDCGIALCREIRGREDYTDVPIVILGAGAPPDARDRAIGAGATDFVELPTDDTELSARIIRAARRKGEAERAPQAIDKETAEKEFATCFDLPPARGIWAIDALLAEMRQRDRDAVYAMTLFSVRMENARHLAARSTPTGFRQAVYSVSRALVEAVEIEATRFAYAGRGVFVGIIYSRDTVALSDIERDAQAALAGHMDAEPGDLTLTIRPIGETRLWTGSAAAEALQACQGPHDGGIADIESPSDPLVLRTGNV